MADRPGFHEDFTRAEQIQSSSDRGFGIVFAIFFVIVGAIKWWIGNPLWPWWLGAAAIMIAIAYTYPRLLSPFNWLWMKLGLLLFMIVNPLVLGLLFYVVIAPIGILLRIFKKDILRRKLDPQASSYWITREPPGPPPDSMKNQF